MNPEGPGEYKLTIEFLFILVYIIFEEKLYSRYKNIMFLAYI